MITRTVKGDLISLALKGQFAVIAHGCNCFNKQKKGISRAMAKTFATDTYSMEDDTRIGGSSGDMNKLGNIQPNFHLYNKSNPSYGGVWVVNCYIQYFWNAESTQLNLAALELCFVKLNHLFKGKHLGIPKIGAGLAGGDWEQIQEIINKVTPNLNITVVEL